jgi:hypothetical protein
MAEVPKSVRDSRERLADGAAFVADEYDTSQQRGEVRGLSNQRSAASNPEVAGAADIGLTHKEIHEARIVRDGEVAKAGIVSRCAAAARRTDQRQLAACNVDGE